MADGTPGGKDLMALICMACHDTFENRRTELTVRTLASLRETVNFERHRIAIADNGSVPDTTLLCKSFLNLVPSMPPLLRSEENLGTAHAINALIRYALDDHEIVVKLDNDVEFEREDWLDDLEDILLRDETIGIVGLKRKDVCQCPENTHPMYHSTLRMLPHIPGQRWLVFEECRDVIGTCIAISPELRKAAGDLYQLEGLYGFDDAIYCRRSNKLGFKNGFYPHIPIDHIDPGGSKYCEWKREEAGKIWGAYQEYVRQLDSDQITPYWKDDVNILNRYKEV